MSNFNIPKTFEDVYNILPNFAFMDTIVFEIARVWPIPPSVKGMGTKKLGNLETR